MKQPQLFRAGASRSLSMILPIISPLAHFRRPYPGGTFANSKKAKFHSAKKEGRKMENMLQLDLFDFDNEVMEIAT